MKLYLGNPAHSAAGAGKDGAKSGAKSKDAEAMLSLSCRRVKPSIATAGRLSQTRLSGPALPSPAGLTHKSIFFARAFCQRLHGGRDPRRRPLEALYCGIPAPN